jgi:hypothetical protein
VVWRAWKRIIFSKKRKVWWIAEAKSWWTERKEGAGEKKKTYIVERLA